MADNQATATDAQAKQIQIQKVYLRDCSFEAPNAVEAFQQEWKPNIDLNLQSQQNAIGDGVFEVVLHITVNAKVNDKSAFLCEVQQAGLFVVKGFEDDETRRVLGAFCPAQLFPYAREAVADLIGKGGFPQLVMQPMNFDALYEQSLQELAKAQSEADQVADRH